MAVIDPERVGLASMKRRRERRAENVRLMLRGEWELGMRTHLGCHCESGGRDALLRRLCGMSACQELVEEPVLSLVYVCEMSLETGSVGLRTSCNWKPVSLCSLSPRPRPLSDRALLGCTVGATAHVHFRIHPLVRLCDFSGSRGHHRLHSASEPLPVTTVLPPCPLGASSIALDISHRRSTGQTITYLVPVAHSWLQQPA